MCSIQTTAMPSDVDRDDQVDELEHLGLGQTAGDLVEQQQPRPRRQRPAELEPLALQQCERACG